jgi:two-component system, OmpR family, response regulator
MPGPKILIVDDNTELANLLAKLLEDAGYTPLCLPRGKPAIEKLRSDKPALAIVDVLLPDVMGYEVAAVCRNELKIPVVFITGVFKGGRNALDAKTKYEALAYFEKPFEAQKLLEVVMKAVKPAAAKPVEPPPTADLDIEIELDEEEAARDPLELTGRVSLREDDGLSATLQGKMLTAAAPVRPPSSPGFSLPRVLRTDAGRSGELKDNLPSLITAFYLAQKSGELLLTKGKVRKAIHFEQGRPVSAMSNVASDRFGYFLFRVGKISETQLNEVLKQTRAAKTRRTGEVLMEMGLLKETERLYYVGQQVKSIIYSVFAWEEGSYQMSFSEPTLDQAIKLDLQPATLIVRGVKKLYSPERLQRLLGPKDLLRPTQDPPYQLSELSLEPWEATLLSGLDGQVTAQRVIAETKRPEGAARASLVALLSLHMIEKS